jgi:hypothetical protein
VSINKISRSRLFDSLKLLPELFTGKRERESCKEAHSVRQSHEKFRGSRASSPSDRLDSVYSIINRTDSRALDTPTADRVLADQTGYELP